MFLQLLLLATCAHALFEDDNAHTISFYTHKIDTYTARDLLGETGHRNAYDSKKRASIDVSKMTYYQPTMQTQPNRKKLVLVHFHYTLNSEERASVSTRLSDALFVQYVPRNTFLMALSAEQAAAAMDLPEVAWVGEYQAQYKPTGHLERLVKRVDTESPYDEHELMVHFYEDADPAVHTAMVKDVAQAVEKVLDAAPAEAESFDHYRLVYKVPATTVGRARRLVEAIASVDSVLYVEQRIKHATRNKYASWLTQSGNKNERSIWARGIRGEGEIIGCADSGLDYDHCFFNDGTQREFGPGAETNDQHRKIMAYFSLADYTDDIGGHGTHVAGSIVGKVVAPGDPAAQTELSDYNGQAPEAKMVFHDIGETGGGLTVRSDVMDKTILEKAYNLGARVHSNSWGCSGDPAQCNVYDGGAMAVDRFVFENRDMLVLFAAGNDGANGMANTQTVGSPATAKNALVVGASQSSYESFQESVRWYDWEERRENAAKQLGVRNLDCCNPPEGSNKVAVRRFCCESELLSDIESDPSHHNERNVAEFSSRGPTRDGRIKPDIMAPGQNIISAHGDGSTRTQQCGLGAPALGNNAARLSMQGTSMATPTAAGNAGLVRQYFKEGWYPSGTKTRSQSINPSGALVKGVMISSTYELDGEIDKTNTGKWETIDPIWPGFSVFQGFGSIRLGQSLKFADSNFNLYVDDVWEGGPNGGRGLDSGESVAYCVQVSGSDTRLRTVLVWDDKAAALNADPAIVNDLDLQSGFSNATVVSGNFEVRRDQRNTVEHTIFYPQDIQRGTYYINVTAANVADGPQPYALVIVGQFSSVTKGGDCETPFSREFQDATTEDLFPYGQVIGPPAAGGIMVLLIGALLQYLKKSGRL